MTKNYNPSSYKDPSGRIFETSNNNYIFRELSPSGNKRYSEIENNNEFINLKKNGEIIYTERSNDFENQFVLLHKKLPFITYPYEWSFDQLKDAAIFHINLQKTLLKNNISFVDSSAYNIQFNLNKPVLIDVLSLKKYQENELWLGHNQFINEFYNPLIFTHYSNISFNNYYKGNLNGISRADVLSIINFKKYFNLSIVLNLIVPEVLERKKNQKKFLKNNNKQNFDKNSYFWLLNSQLKAIENLKINIKKSNWNDYEENRSYTEEELQVKRNFIKTSVIQYQPNLILDLGANKGEFSILALDNGAKGVIAAEKDPLCVNWIYNYAKKKDLNILPIVFDFKNPSSPSGWHEKEKDGFLSRSKFDYGLFLAIIHHACLAENIPLEYFLSWIFKLSKSGIIEFVDIEDPNSKKLLEYKGNIFPNYNKANFEQLLNKEAKVIKCSQINKTRWIYEYQIFK